MHIEKTQTGPRLCYVTGADVTETALIWYSIDRPFENTVTLPTLVYNAILYILHGYSHVPFDNTLMLFKHVRMCERTHICVYGKSLTLACPLTLTPTI